MPDATADRTAEKPKDAPDPGTVPPFYFDSLDFDRYWREAAEHEAKAHYYRTLAIGCALTRHLRGITPEHFSPPSHWAAFMPGLRVPPGSPENADAGKPRA